METLVIALAIGGVVGVTIAGVEWIVTRIARRWGRDDVPLPTLPKPERISPELADAIRKRADIRRSRAEEHLREGSQIASGQSTPDRIIRMIGKR
jgi:hypothetical protein